MKILILANHYNTLRIFRRELIKKLAENNEVVLSVPPCEEENREILQSYGAKVVFTDFERRGMNPLTDLKLLRAYKRLIKEEKPDKVITYTVKCNIYGSLACKALHIPHCVNITGLGSPIEKGGLVGKLVVALYKLSVNKAETVFFENSGDRDKMVKLGAVRKNNTYVLHGAGVNLQEFSPLPYPKDEDGTHFLFIGRIMQEKGVDELFDAIRLLKKDGLKFTFNFIGWHEENYASAVKQLEQDGLIRFHGFQQDVRPFIQSCHCSVLPSWHEGMSNTLLESAACARPLITTSVHGCMEAVQDGISGYLVPLKDAQGLYEAMKRFINLSNAEKEQMGIAGRKHMEEIFDKEKVVGETIDCIFG